MGMRLRYLGADALATRRGAHASGLFASLTLAAFCSGALLLASQDAYLAENIGGMFKLSHPIAKNTILLISLIAGIGLVVVEYHLTRAAARFARFDENR